MQAFHYKKADDIPSAVSTSSAPNAKFVAGGTTLIDLMKLNVERPTTLIDINSLALTKIEELPAGGVKIGAMVRNSDLAHDATVYDQRTGHPVNNNYADYLVPVNTDVPNIDVIFLNYPDTILNEYGARGIGEIGLTGCASALTSATYHATGVRVRELPIRIEQLLRG